MDSLPEDLQYTYNRAIRLFKSGQLEEAVTLLEALKEQGIQSAELDELLEDARLKRRMAEAQVVVREAPRERRPFPWRIVLPILLLLLLGGGAFAFLSGGTDESSGENNQAQVDQPTATPRIVVQTITPTSPPATAEPSTTSAPPTPTTEPSPEPSTGNLVVGPPEGQNQLVRPPQNIELILDASGTMDGFVEGAEGKKKIEMARDALAGVISILPEDTNLALRTYGTQRSNDCTDLRLVRPLGRHSRDDLLASLQALAPVTDGMTPIGASIKAAQEDLADAQGSSTLILVSDGEENCGEDPVAAAYELMERIPGLKIHVIGFDIGPPEWVGRLRAIANAGKGTYFDARNSAQLNDALLEAIKLEYEVRDAEDQVVGTGTVGNTPLELPPGHYRLVLVGGDQAGVEFDVVAGQTTRFVIQSEGETFTLAPVTSS